MIITICGILSIQAASYFHKVATTDDADQEHIVNAFRKLRVVYLMLSIWIIVSLVFVFAAILFMIVFLAVRGGQ